jgi:DNA polymerase
MRTGRKLEQERKEETEARAEIFQAAGNLVAGLDCFAAEKAAINRAQSRRFALAGPPRISRQRLDCECFSTALRPAACEQIFFVIRPPAVTMSPMSESYWQLLDATIQHLEGMKTRGVRHIAVTPEALRALALPARKMAVTSPRPQIQRPAFGTPVSDPARPEFRKPAGPEAVAPPVAPSPSSIRQPPSSSEKSAAFAALRERAMACVKCPNLAASRQSVVFGVGNIDSPLMFIGEAPGADEDEQGEPFVGAAGQLLTKIIGAAGLSRADVYIANILKCRPDTPGQTSGNRKPTPAEMATCIPYLHEQIDLIRPKVIVALGATAVEGLLGKTVGITKLRGNWQTYRDTPLMPTYHPAYLLRNQSLANKREVWEDMLAVMEKLAMPISEKQRNFFLKAQ